MVRRNPTLALVVLRARGGTTNALASRVLHRSSAAIACFVASIGTASADEPSSYVSTGGAIGVASAIDWLYGEVGIDVGHRTTTAWWLHANLDAVARIATGPTNRVMFVGPEPRWYAVRIGLERRGCRDDGAVCLLGGVDLGYRTSSVGTDVHVVGRAALELGGARVRVRSEASLLLAGCGDVDPDSDCFFDAGIGWKLGAVYQW